MLQADRTESKYSHVLVNTSGRYGHFYLSDIINNLLLVKLLSINQKNRQEKGGLLPPFP